MLGGLFKEEMMASSKVVPKKKVGFGAGMVFITKNTIPRKKATDEAADGGRGEGCAEERIPSLVLTRKLRYGGNSQRAGPDEVKGQTMDSGTFSGPAISWGTTR